MTEQLLVRIPEAAARLGIGVTKIYELFQAGDIATVTIGGARRVSVHELERYVESLQSAPMAS
jgi:excisionase family DNA binding protein